MGFGPLHEAGRGQKRKKREDMTPNRSRAVSVAEATNRALRKREPADGIIYHGYPHHCYVTDPYAPHLAAVVYPGCSVYFALRGEDAEKSPEELNRREGVTPAQLAAMEAGVKHGWENPLADPMAYNAAGEFLGIA